MRENERWGEGDRDQERLTGNILFMFCLQLFRTTRDLFLPAHLRAMTVMLIIWFMYSFG